MSGGGELSRGYLANNAPRLFSYSLFGAFNIALFLYAAHEYEGKGTLVQLARGCGAVINFNAAFCLLPMMRLFISWIRRTPIARFFALEDSIDFHRVSGHVMFTAAIVHTAAYFAIYWELPVPLVDSFTGTLAALTGCILLGIFVILWLFALERSRKKWPYEAFLTAHALAIPIALGLLIHSPHYWKWFIVGGSGYLADRAVRFWRMRRPSQIIKARHLPSQVTELVIERPRGWTFRPGDFVWILIPSLSRLEWHPFTISSAPERERTFSIHVRTLGDWTARLHREAPRLAETRVFFDGPHGAPANDIFDTRVAVLVAAGIGVTPFASILQSLLARQQQVVTGEILPLQRVYFYWINRDHRAFEWFTEMDGELKRADSADLFEIHLYVTDPPPELPPLTVHGRPDWDAELARIAAAHGSEDVGLFFCGPHTLAKTLHGHARTHGWRFSEEHF